LVISVQLESLPVTIRHVPESLLALLAVARVFLLHIISQCSWEQRSRILALSPPLPNVAPVVVSRPSPSPSSSTTSLSSTSIPSTSGNDWSDASRVAVMAAAGGDFGVAPVVRTRPLSPRSALAAAAGDSKSDLTEVRLDLGDIGGSGSSGSGPTSTGTPSIDGGTTPTSDGIDFVALDREEDAAARFIHALVDACIDIDINDGTNDLHLEVINLLLVCLSTQVTIVTL
jgi:hypothetical protein